MKRKIMYSAVAVALLTLTACTSDTAEPVDNEPIAEVKPTTNEVSSETPEPTVIEETEITPLSKDEVLAKFELYPDEQPIENGTFTFVGNRTDTADYYSLDDTAEYRNASVIFKDGQIARVKLIPEGDADVNALFEQFGITDEPREVGNGLIKTYEVALIPLYWSQNIEKYPFEQY